VTSKNPGTGDIDGRAVTDTVIAETSAQLAVRPQPLGAFALPLGYLLIPAGDDTEPARAALLAGCLPEVWPARLDAHRHALAGDRGSALAALDGTDPVTRYNRFVLDPDLEDIGSLRSVLGEFAPLLDVVAFALGRIDEPPELGGADGELAAVVLAARASHLIAHDPAAAIATLDAAVDCARTVSRPLAGVLIGASASVCLAADDPGEAHERMEKALRLLDDADGLRVERAELHLNAAGVMHDQAQHNPGLIVAAVPHYHSALQLIRREDAPLLWAAAHADLAAAYLTMPMVEASSQLRLGVAAQSLRSALTVYTREDHPEHWASVQLNLANSLVYTPSKHQADNLVEAVELYEAVLDARDRHTDPLGRARVLANQGNALAHLGIFTEARAKLYEARSLFEELGDEVSMRAVRGILDEVARQITLNRTEAAPR
jgi:tetratricopeptide (TPR) repeat protein